jgi:hypothetical protein
VESFRGLAMSHPIALWMLRLACGDRPATAEDTVDIVVAIARGQGFASLSGAGYRRRVGRVARLGELARLVAWYAR